MNSGSEHYLTQIEMHLHARSERAVLVSDDGNKPRAVWLPLSQTDMVPTKNPKIYEVTLPEWLASKHDLI